MDLGQINDTYGGIIWSVAGRYHMGVWEQMDVYNELLLQIYVAMGKGKLPTQEDEDAYPLIKSFVITKAIDIIRKEYKRQGMKTAYKEKLMVERPVDEYGDVRLDAEATKTDEEYEMEKRFIWELLTTHLKPEHAVFIFELAFPSEETIKIALRDQSNANLDDKLRMNSNNLRILPRHVAESLGPKYNLSKATMSRVKKQARGIVGKILSYALKDKKHYVTKG